MSTLQEQPRKPGRGRWRRISMRAGLGLALLVGGGASAGLGLCASGASAAPKRQVRATRALHVHVLGGWRAPLAQVGHVTSLSAGTLPQAAPGTRVGYRWTVVSKPKGSRARLTGSSSAHPTLRPDRPGRYVLEVRTGELPAAATDSQTSLCDRGCATHRVTLTAAVSAGPLGVPVNTITSQNGQWGVQVGDQSTVGAEFYAAPIQTDPLQLLVLNRGTLAPVGNDSFTNDAQGAQQLARAVIGLPSSDLVIITRPDFVPNSPESEPFNVTTACDAAGLPTPARCAYGFLSNALSKIGAAPVPWDIATGQAPLAANTTSGTCSEFSVIGIPGLPGGAHTSDCQVNLSHSSAALQGYFRQDLSEAANYTFVDDTRVPFDTGEATADPAVVTVGSDEPGSPFPKATYTSDNLNGGAGFFVVVLDSGSLKLEDEDTFSDDATGLTGMAGWLVGSDTDPHAITIVRSIGKVGAPASGDTDAVQSWDQVASELQDLGGSKFYFDALNGSSSSEYAQVGIGGASSYPTQSTQVATVESSGSGRLTGLLAYNNANEFYPSESYVPSTLNDTNRPLGGTLPGIISLPSSAWPDRDTQSDQNVLACVAQNLPGAHLQMPIESNYTNLNLANNWAGWASDIGQPGFYRQMARDSACGPFTQADADTVIKQLQTEWNDVAIVDTFIANLQKPLVDSQGNATQIQSITEAVDNDLATSSAQTTVDGKGIVADMLWAVSSVPIPDDQTPQIFAGSMNILAAGLDLADATNNNDSGVNLPDDQIATTGADLGNELEAQYTTSIHGLGNIGDILVSDWTKLQDAAQNAADSPGAAADWSFTDKQLSEAADVLLLSTRRTAYETLFPLGYSLYRLQNGDDSLQSASQYMCAEFLTDTEGTSIINPWQPFLNVQQPSGSFQVRSTGGTTEQWAFAAPTPDVTTAANRAQMPTASLLSLMFGPPQSGDTVQAGPLFTPLQFAVQTYHDGGKNTTTITHYYDSTGGWSNVSSKDFCKVVTGS